MIFKLADIELHIGDEYVEAAEQLIAQHLVPKLYTVDKNLYTANIETDDFYEIEIQLTGKRVKAYTCDCKNYLKNGICEHITAVLLQLRKQVKEQTDQLVVKKEQKPVKLNINSVLRQVSAEELQTFVRKYAKRDRQFSLQLKAHFARKIELASPFEKYAQLLTSAIRLERNAKGFFKTGGLGRVLRIVEDIFFHAETALNQLDYQECLAALRAVIKQLHLIERFGKKSPRIKEAALSGLSILSRLQQQEIAPALESQLWNLVLETAFHPTLIRQHYTDSLKDILSKMANTTARQKKLLEQIQPIRQHSELDLSIRKMFSLWEIMLLEKCSDTTTLHSRFEEIILNPQLLKQIIADYRNAGERLRSKKLIEQALQFVKNGTLSVYLQDELLQISLELQDFPLARTLSRQLFLQQSELKYFAAYKSANPDNWDQAYRNLIEELQQKKTGKSQRILAEIYVREGHSEALIQLLQETASLDLLLQFDHYLLPEQASVVRQLYHQLLEDYLQDHLGLPASQKVRLAIQHLHQIQATKLARQLLTFIREKYAWRQSLMEELEIF